MASKPWLCSNQETKSVRKTNSQAIKLLFVCLNLAEQIFCIFLEKHKIRYPCTIFLRW
jgi:hypothetical protein